MTRIQLSTQEIMEAHRLALARQNHPGQTTIELPTTALRQALIEVAAVRWARQNKHAATIAFPGDDVEFPGLIIDGAPIEVIAVVPFVAAYREHVAQRRGAWGYLFADADVVTGLVDLARFTTLDRWRGMAPEEFLSEIGWVVTP